MKAVKAATDNTATPPDCLTVEEMAAVLRISRTSAYAQVNEYLSSAGTTGIPAIRVARQIRVPRVALEDRLGGPISWPIPKRSTRSAAEPPSRTALMAAPPERRQLSLDIES